MPWFGFKTPHVLFGATFALMLCLCAPAGACRYSVRDVAFVQLRPDSYRLVYHLPENAAGDLETEFNAVADAALAGTNVAIVSADALEDEETAGSAHGMAPAGQTLAAALLGPESAGAAPLPVELGATASAWKAALASIADSPVRASMRRDLPDALCVAVFAEGPDAQTNKSALNDVRRAVERVADNMAYLEKPARRGPALLTVPWRVRSQERVLLWSLCGGEAPEEAFVAVVFGRARRLGPVMRVPRLDPRKLARLMALAGASCECGLDRKYMQGHLLLMRWTESDYARMAESLGFATESPMVKMEISQILAHPAAAAGPPPVTGLGYREMALNVEDTPSEPPAPPPAAEPAETAAPAAASKKPVLAEEPAAGYPVSILGGLAVLVVVNLGIAAVVWVRRQRENR